MAVDVTWSSAAADLKLPSLAAASKAWSDRSGGSFLIGVDEFFSSETEFFDFAMRKSA
jgi:hypothetical protein